MRAVDTNVLLRILIRDAPQQVLAAESFIENGAWISIPALLETAWALGSIYGRSMQEITSMIDMLLRHQRFVLQESDAVSDALDQLRAKPALGFADCLIHALARKHGHLPLGTFDRHLGKLPGAQRL